VTGRRQKHKGLKRPKHWRRHWHRGPGEALRWARVRLPDVRSGAYPTTGHPQLRNRRKGTTP
jgi:hypothetical protein